MGKMRVDELHYYLQSLLPAKSGAFERFYADAWKAPEGSVPCGAHGGAQAAPGPEVEQQPAQPLRLGLRYRREATSMSIC